ncbi:MAG TPA: hypothetical protein VMD53_14925 [Rhizomicrobium sp.]|nr:hypothetical protein [Rhizomicrobium sp.]
MATGLGRCTTSASVQESGRAVTMYAFDYLPDAKGFVAHGKMWIPDSTGLPLREEMQNPVRRLFNTMMSVRGMRGSFQVGGGTQ